MSRIVTVQCAVECPHCDEEIEVEFDTLAGSGRVPRTYVWCDACGQQFNIESTLDIDIDSKGKP